MSVDETNGNNENVEAEVGSDVLEMSDEDFLSQLESDLSVVEKEMNKDEEEEEEEEVEEVTTQEEVAEVEAEAENPEEGVETPEPKETKAEGEEEDTTSDVQEPTIDYEAEYKKLFSPIKASGKMVTMKSMDQVINRIQLAEDYQKKMHDMRPHTAALKALDKAGVLNNQDKMNFLLDISANKPEAIKKLIADSKLDVIELADEDELEASKNYSPDNHMMSPGELAIDEVITSINESPKFKDTMDLVMKVMDSKSRDIISDRPDYIGSLNSDMESGIYDTVMDEVRYGREMGYIPKNIPDIEAYIGTVKLMSDFEASKNQPQQQQPVEPVRKIDTRKRKAMSSPGGGSKGKKQFNPIDVLEMSDDDFLKQFGLT